MWYNNTFEKTCSAEGFTESIQQKAMGKMMIYSFLHVHYLGIILLSHYLILFFDSFQEFKGFSGNY